MSEYKFSTFLACCLLVCTSGQSADTWQESTCTNNANLCVLTGTYVGGMMNGTNPTIGEPVPGGTNVPAGSATFTMTFRTSGGKHYLDVGIKMWGYPLGGPYANPSQTKASDAMAYIPPAGLTYMSTNSDCSQWSLTGNPTTPTFDNCKFSMHTKTMKFVKWSVCANNTLQITRGNKAIRGEQTEDALYIGAQNDPKCPCTATSPLCPSWVLYNDPDLTGYMIKVVPPVESPLFYATVGVTALIFASGWLYLFWSVRDPPEAEEGEEDDPSGLTGNAGQEAEAHRFLNSVAKKRCAQCGSPVDETKMRFCAFCGASSDNYVFYDLQSNEYHHSAAIFSTGANSNAPQQQGYAAPGEFKQ